MFLQYLLGKFDIEYFNTTLETHLDKWLPVSK